MESEPFVGEMGRNPLGDENENDMDREPPENDPEFGDDNNSKSIPFKKPAVRCA